MKYTAVNAKKEEIKIAKNAFNSYAAETVGTVRGHSGLGAVGVFVWRRSILWW